MRIKPRTPSTNGHRQAPPALGGASAARTSARQATTFLEDPPIRTLNAGAYAAQRFLLGGAPASRYVTILFGAMALVWLTGLLPGRWVGVAVFAVLMLAHIAYGRVMKRRDFVRFEAAPVPPAPPTALDATSSLPVYVTGGLSVEGNEQRFTCLPGFYKTFATREHALLCRVRRRDLLRVLHWPTDEVGMWYAFVQPHNIRRIEWGRLHYAPEPMFAIAVVYDAHKTSQKGLRRKTVETSEVETLFLASTDEEDLRQILGDLMADDTVREKSVVAHEATAR